MRHPLTFETLVKAIVKIAKWQPLIFQIESKVIVIWQPLIFQIASKVKAIVIRTETVEI